MIQEDDNATPKLFLPTPTSTIADGKKICQQPKKSYTSLLTILVSTEVHQHMSEMAIWQQNLKYNTSDQGHQCLKWDHVNRAFLQIYEQL
jgi:hypothetical protein